MNLKNSPSFPSQHWPKPASFCTLASETAALCVKMLSHLLLICDFFVDLCDGLVIDLGDVLTVQHQCQVTFRPSPVARTPASPPLPKGGLQAEPTMLLDLSNGDGPVTVPFRHLEIAAAGAQPPLVAS